MAKKSHADTEAQAEVEALSQAKPLDAIASKDTPAKVGKKEEQPVYELGFHVVPTVPEEGVAAVVEKLKSALGKAEIISEQFPVRMSLAYTVERSVQGKREKYNEAYFGCIKFALDRDSVQTLRETLRSMPQILRFLVINTVREDAPAPRRVIFTSRQLEGETIKKPDAVPEKAGEVSEEELDKSIDALVSEV